MAISDLRLTVPGGWNETAARADFTAQSNPPLVERLEVVGGRNNPDFLGGGHSPLTLVSERFVAAADACHLSGWASYSIELIGKLPPTPKRYSGLRIHGRCGPIDDGRSARVLAQTPPSGAMMISYRGLYFDESAWDGTDLFVPTLKHTFLFCTEKAAKCFRQAHLTGMVLTPIEEVVRYML